MAEGAICEPQPRQGRCGAQVCFSGEGPERRPKQRKNRRVDSRDSKEEEEEQEEEKEEEVEKESSS